MANDNNTDLGKRIESLEKELERVKTLYEKTLKYQKDDPEVSLAQARKSAEAICKQIYINEGMEKGGKPAGKMMLNDLISSLLRSGVLPQHVVISLGTIQAFGNFGTHDQGLESENITEKFIQPCLSALTTVVEWYFTKYHGKSDMLGVTMQPVTEPVPEPDLSKTATQKGPTPKAKKVPAYEKICNAMESFGEGYIASYGDIMDYCNREYGETKKSTFRTYIISCTVNHNTRVHYSPNKKPRTELLDNDVLFQVEKGKVCLYDPEKHGDWHIKLGDDGKLHPVKS